MVDVPPDRSSLPSLSPEERRTVLYASALGTEFDFRVLREATGKPEEDLAEELERLVHQGVLRERPPPGRYRFARERVRAGLYADLTESRARVIHTNIARALERLYPRGPPPELLGEFGRHAFLAKLHEASLRYNREAGRQARRLFALEDAAHHYERARRDLQALPVPRGEEEGQLLLEMGEVYVALGEEIRADRLFVEALERTPVSARTLRAYLLLARAEVTRGAGPPERFPELCREALSLFEAEGDRPGLARAHRLLGQHASARGDHQTALAEGERAVGLLDPAKDRREYARASVDLGNALALRPSGVGTREAIVCFRRALGILEELQDFPELARACNNIGVTLGGQDPALGLSYLALAREYADRSKDRRMRGWALFNGVEFQLKLSRLPEALRDNEEARVLLEPYGDRLVQRQLDLNRGMLALRQGQFPDAERAFRDALRQAEQLGDPYGRSEAHLRIAQCLILSGRPGEARHELAQAEQIQGERWGNLGPAYHAVRSILSPADRAGTGRS